MTDQPIPVEFEEATQAGLPTRGARLPRAVQVDTARPGATERRRTFLATLDKPLLVVIGILLAIGSMMVYSTTFDWSYQSFGNEAAIFLQHVRNIVIGLVAMIVLTVIDYRIWRRFAVPLLLVTVGLLVAVLLFSDAVFGARRAFFNGSYQPGEVAELTIIIYMGAWLGSKRVRIRSITYGLIPFSVLVGLIAGLVMLQPDLSTAAMIIVVSVTMFFLAGANLLQLTFAGLVGGAVMLTMSQRLNYAQERLQSFVSGAADLTQANYHVQQAVIAFVRGGWTGVGLGEGRQKFGFLPAPHTDSIFAIIGEELGVVGALIVVLLYVLLVFRGLQIARRAPDMFGSLIAAGVTIWVASKALLNIAVMTAVLPATGAVLPFISFGGSSLVVLMAGVGFLLSVARVSARQALPERRDASAVDDRGGGNWRSRVSRPGGERGDHRAVPRR